MFFQSCCLLFLTLAYGELFSHLFHDLKHKTQIFMALTCENRERPELSADFSQRGRFHQTYQGFSKVGALWIISHSEILRVTQGDKVLSRWHECKPVAMLFSTWTESSPDQFCYYVPLLFAGYFSQVIEFGCKQHKVRVAIPSLAWVQYFFYVFFKDFKTQRSKSLLSPNILKVTQH